MSETIRWERAEELLRALTQLAEQYGGSAEVITPYGEQRLAVRVEILPKEPTEVASGE